MTLEDLERRLRALELAHEKCASCGRIRRGHETYLKLTRSKTPTYSSVEALEAGAQDCLCPACHEKYGWGAA